MAVKIKQLGSVSLTTEREKNLSKGQVSPRITLSTQSIEYLNWVQCLQRKSIFFWERVPFIDMLQPNTISDGHQQIL